METTAIICLIKHNILHLLCCKLSNFCPIGQKIPFKIHYRIYIDPSLACQHGKGQLSSRFIATSFTNLTHTQIYKKQKSESLESILDESCYYEVLLFIQELVYENKVFSSSFFCFAIRVIELVKFTTYSAYCIYHRGRIRGYFVIVNRLPFTNDTGSRRLCVLSDTDTEIRRLKFY